MSNELISAVKERSLSKIKARLQAGDDINFMDSSRRTALSWAARFGFADVVELLIQNKAKHSLRCNENDTPFLSAIVYGKLNIIQLLTTKMLTVLEANDLEEGLFRAAKLGQLEIVQHLKSLSFDYKGKNEQGKDALLVATEQGHLHVVQFLYHQSPNESLKSCDNQGNTAFHIAISHSHFSIIEFFLSYAPQTFLFKRNKDGQDGYALSIQIGSLELAKHLLKHGCYVDTSIPERYPNRDIKRFNKAALELFKVLDPNKQDEFLNLLTILGDSINARRFVDGNTALHIAILKENITAIFALGYHALLDIENQAKVTAYQLCMRHTDLYIQTAGHFFKTLRLFERYQSLARIKPSQGKPSDLKIITERKILVELEKTEYSDPNHQTKENDDFSKELKITLEKLKQLKSIGLPKKSIKYRLLSYMFYYLGNVLKIDKPNLAYELFNSVQATSEDYYFSHSHFEVYCLIKYQQIHVPAPINTDHDVHEKRLLIQELLYSKRDKDNEGMTIQQLIQDYSLEKPENILKLNGIKETLKSDCISIKNDFLVTLDILREKNIREQELLSEISRLTEALQSSSFLQRDSTLSSRNSSPLESIPEMRPIPKQTDVAMQRKSPLNLLQQVQCKSVPSQAFSNGHPHKRSYSQTQISSRATTGMSIFTRSRSQTNSPLPQPSKPRSISPNPIDLMPDAAPLSPLPLAHFNLQTSRHRAGSVVTSPTSPPDAMTP